MNSVPNDPMPQNVPMQSTRILRTVAIMTGIIAMLGVVCSRVEGQSVADAPGMPNDPPAAMPVAAAAVPEKAIDRSALVQKYNEARDAYKRREWEVASEKYAEVSRQCPGTPLALECNYYALFSHWQMESPESPSLTRAWLKEAASLHRKAASLHRKAAAIGSEDSRNPALTPRDSWIAQAHWLLTQSERNQGKIAESEERLRALLEIQGATRDPSVAWPVDWKPSQKHWNALGNLLVTANRDLDVAQYCFEQSSEIGNGTREQQCEALVGIVRCHLATGDLTVADESMVTLDSIAEDASSKIRLALLRAQWYRQKGEPSRVLSVLQPAVDLAIQQQPDTRLIYELALALAPDGMPPKTNHANDASEPANQLWNEIITRDSSSPIAIEARVRLAQARLADRQWDTTKTLLDDAISLGLPPSLLCHSRFLRGQANAALGFFEEARDDFQLALKVIQGNEGLELAIRFDLAEVLVRLQAWDQAIPHWEFLIAQGMGSVDETRDSDLVTTRAASTKQLPAWMATVWLRQAEMQALRRDWNAAEKIVYQIREQFPECNRRDEVDYLLARCMVSKAKFDDARQLLTAIASSDRTSSPEWIARSWWMVGETYLMQRRYSDALDAYERVLGTGASEYWHSAARMQIGQCHELLRNPESARTAYQQVLDRDSQGAFGVQARERIALLPSTSQLPTDQIPATQNPATQRNASTSNASTSNAAAVGNKR